MSIFPNSPYGMVEREHAAVREARLTAEAELVAANEKIKELKSSLRNVKKELDSSRRETQEARKDNSSSKKRKHSAEPSAAPAAKVSKDRVDMLKLSIGALIDQAIL